MKSAMKKVLIMTIIILLLNNFIFGTCYANDYHVETTDDIVDFLTGGIGILVAVLTLPLRLVAMGAGWAVNTLTARIAYVDKATQGNSVEDSITPFDIFFNKVKIFDINFFDIKDDGSIISQVRASVASWYYVMRTIAAAVLLVILIYVGIRMAISTIASDRAIYKRMLVDWTASLALIFILQYIMIFTISANNAIVNAISLVVDSEKIANVYDVIARMAIPKEISLKAVKAIISLDSLAATAIFCMLVWQTLGLVFSYFNRMLKLAFLIIVSPLISLTYSIDKMGDGKAQALGTWLKEFVFTILIQPFHCVIYMCFIDAAFDILVAKSGIGGMVDTGGALAASIVAMLCVRFTKEGEKIVRKIFAFKDDNSATSLAGGMAAAALFLNQAKNLGKTARNTVNTAKAFGKNLSNIRRNAKIEAIAIGAYMADKEGSKSFSEYKEEASIKVNKKEADDAISKTHENYKLGDSEFKKQLNKEIARVKDLNPGMSNAEAKQIARRNVAQKARKKGTLRGRAISKATSIKNKASNTGVGKAISEIRNSETAKLAKEFTKSSINAGLGFMVGAGAYGTGESVASAITSGIAMSKTMEEFMSGSKKTLAQGITQNLKNIGVKDSEEARNICKEVREEADKYNGGDKSKDELKKCIDEIKKAAASLDGDINVTEIGNKVEQAFNNPLTAPDAIKSILSNNKIDTNKGAGKKLLDYSNKRAIYNQMQNAEAAGITQSDLLESVDNSFVKSKEQSIVAEIPNALDTVYDIEEHDISEEYDMSSYEAEDIRKDIEEHNEVIKDYKEKIDKLEDGPEKEQLVEEMKEFEEEISRQYEQLTEITPETDGYQEVLSKIERLKVEQASIIARKLVDDNNYLRSQGNNLARRYQNKLDEAIEILKQNIERTKSTKDYAKYQDRLKKLQDQSQDLLKLMEKNNEKNYK